MNKGVKLLNYISILAEGNQLLNSFTNYKNVDDTCGTFSCIFQDIVSKNWCMKKVNRKNSKKSNEDIPWDSNCNSAKTCLKYCRHELSKKTDVSSF